MTAFINKILFISGLILASGSALGESHEYINYSRSSAERHAFVEQSVEGEYGQYFLSGSDDSASATQFWKGYGITTEFGLELMKFLQFTASHTFVNVRFKEDALQSLGGSRLNGGLRLSFLSPVGNLEAGGGFQGSRLDYQNRLEHASFYGSGVYYSLGINYFLSSRISITGQGKMSKEHLDRSSGSSTVRAIDANTTHMSLGFRIWL